MKLDKRGGMNTIFAIFIAVVLAVAATYLIRSQTLKTKTSSNVSKLSRDQRVLQKFLVLKSNEFRNYIAEDESSAGPKDLYDCSGGSEQEDSSFISNRVIKFSCKKIAQGALEVGSSNQSKYVKGVVVSAMFKSGNYSGPPVKLFIPDYFSIGTVVEVGDSSANLNRRVSNKSPKIGEGDLENIVKGSFIYEGDKITSGVDNYLIIRFHDDTFVRIGGGGKQTEFTAEEAEYVNKVTERYYSLNLNYGIIKVKSSHHNSDNYKEEDIKIKIRFGRGIEVTPHGENGSEYILCRYQSENKLANAALYSSVTVLKGSTKILSVLDSSEIVVVDSEHEVFIKDELIHDPPDTKIKYSYELGKIGEAYQKIPKEIRASWW